MHPYMCGEHAVSYYENSLGSLDFRQISSIRRPFLAVRVTGSRGVFFFDVEYIYGFV